MNMLERMIFEARGGMFREFEGLTTHLGGGINLVAERAA